MDVFGKSVVIGGLAVGSVLAALSAYVLYGAPWEERHGAGERIGVRDNHVTWLSLASDACACRREVVQEGTPELGQHVLHQCRAAGIIISHARVTSGGMDLDYSSPLPPICRLCRH